MSTHPSTIQSLALFLCLLIGAHAHAADVMFSGAAPLNANAATDGAADGQPAIAAAGNRKWMAVWSSTNSDDSSSDYDILSAASIDDGATWGTPAAVNDFAGSDSGDDFHPDVATDGAGRWCVVWDSKHNLAGTGTEGDILCSYSISAGAFWYPPVAVNHRAKVDSAPDSKPVIATDGTGTWVCAWQSTDDLGGSIGADMDILFSRSINGGFSWSNAEPLNTSADTDSLGDYNPRIATDGSVWITVWDSYEHLGGAAGTDIEVYCARSTDSGQTWSDPLPLNSLAATDSGSDFRPRIATDGAGNWLAAWESSESSGGVGSDTDIWVSSSTDGGETWSPQAVLNSNATSDGTAADMNLSVAYSGLGTWIAAWDSPDSLGDTLGDDRDILYATSRSMGMFWSPVAPLSAIAATDDPGGSPETHPDFTVALGSDGAGALVAAWVSRNDLGLGIGSDYDVLYGAALPPAVQAIVRNGSSPTAQAEVEFVILFSENVTGVDLTDFELEAHNLVGESFIEVTGGGNIYVVRVASGSGAGTMEVHLRDNDTIIDLDGNRLGGPGAGNGDYDSDEVFVIDRLAPVLVVSGQNPLYIDCGSGPFMTPSATAFDTTDGDLASAIQVTGIVDTSILAVYPVDYEVSDSLGNTSTVVLEVNVVDVTAPDLVLLGDNPLIWPCETPYIDPGATVSDICDPSPILDIDISAVDVAHAGSYLVHLSAQDERGNVRSENRTVVIEDPCGVDPCLDVWHTADQNQDFVISLSELLRLVQFFNSEGFHCANPPASTEDSYVPGPGADRTCCTHDSDYHPSAPDWLIDLSELLRVIQFFNTGAFHHCPGMGTEDEFCPG